ncbi:hypothetical protein DB41_KF00040 [Neochlamydia sp. TUME1]|nr:hypothetical protein [Neochlamydia sp. TUME1]KIC72642.1 hypothetical protein DB41_KF00040 [Neochlamydia sp. TUME1]
MPAAIRGYEEKLKNLSVELQFKATQQLTKQIENTSEEETNLHDLQMFLINRLRPHSPFS